MSSSALPPPLKAAAASLNSLAAPPTKLFVMEILVVQELSVLTEVMVMEEAGPVVHMETVTVPANIKVVPIVAATIGAGEKQSQGERSIFLMEILVIVELAAAASVAVAMDADLFLDSHVPPQTGVSATLFHSKVVGLCQDKNVPQQQVSNVVLFQGNNADQFQDK